MLTAIKNPKYSKNLWIFTNKISKFPLNFRISKSLFLEVIETNFTSKHMYIILYILI